MHVYVRKRGKKSRCIKEENIQTISLKVNEELRYEV